MPLSWNNAWNRRGNSGHNASPGRYNGYGNGFGNFGGRQGFNPGQAQRQGARGVSGGGQQRRGADTTGGAGRENLFTQPLPDGVMMYPANEDNLRNLHNLQGNAPIPAAPPNVDAPASEQAPQALPPPAELVQNGPGPMERLKTFIQNERNGALFYKHLSGVAPVESYRGMLGRISVGCDSSKAIYGGLYARLAGETFLPEESGINDMVAFREGVLLAIGEESATLREMAELFQETEDAGVIKALNGQIARKVSDLSLLQLMLR